MKYTFYKTRGFCLFILTLVFIFSSSCAPAPTTTKTFIPAVETPIPATPVTPYMKMDPAPDSDKTLPVPHGDNSCWIHTASNMLAGAGYGNGSTVQDRATDIWNDMDPHYRLPNGNFNGGWPNTAIYWWLGSTNNTWASINSYTLVIPYGSYTMIPWADADAPMMMGNALRACNMVGLGIRWPTDAVHADGTPVVGVGGHAITLWGDDQTSRDPLTNNPGGLRVADSDTDTGGDIQAYTYDAFNNPNPGGPNEGNGWYFNAYGNPHPYISAAFILVQTSAGAGANSVLVMGSYKVQNTSDQAASDLHYNVGTDVDILTYRTWLDWVATPTITEDQSPPRELTVDWVFTDTKVDPYAWVTISTELVETSWNSINYSDVYFTYDMESVGTLYPDLSWNMETPDIDAKEPEKIPNVVGGHIIGSFDVIDSDTNEPVGQYRFVHQYLYNQSPELHTFYLTSKLTDDKEFIFANLHFGHSYFYPTEDELWQFENWMTDIDAQYSSGEPVRISIDWTGQLPYPEGFPPSTDGNPAIEYK
jgi:hypothetical protein